MLNLIAIRKMQLKVTMKYHFILIQFSSVQSLSRVRLFATPWIAAHQASLSIKLLEFTQIHVHRVGDAIQPSHPLSSPSPPAPNPSQRQGLFQWVNCLHEVAKVLEFQPQHQSFQWTPRTGLHLANFKVNFYCRFSDRVAWNMLPFCFLF